MSITVKCVGCPHVMRTTSAIQPFCPKCGSVMIAVKARKERKV